MSYTAAALSFMFENLSKPVVLTGSQVCKTECCYILERIESFEFRFLSLKHEVTVEIILLEVYY